MMAMDTPGIEVRPHPHLAGQPSSAEMFLDDVRIPVADLVGPENGRVGRRHGHAGIERGSAMLPLLLASFTTLEARGTIAPPGERAVGRRVHSGRPVRSGPS